MPRFAHEREALGQRVRSLRRAQGLTQEQAAELCDVGVKHFQQVEAGQRGNPTLATLVGLAAGLGHPIWALFGAESPKRAGRGRRALRPPRR